MKAIISYLEALLVRTEARIIGSVEDHLSPLKDIVAKLEATKAAAEKAADQARQDAADLEARAQAHIKTMVDAARAAEKISGLFS